MIEGRKLKSQTPLGRRKPLAPSPIRNQSVRRGKKAGNPKATRGGERARVTVKRKHQNRPRERRRCTENRSGKDYNGSWESKEKRKEGECRQVRKGTQRDKPNRMTTEALVRERLTAGNANRAKGKKTPAKEKNTGPWGSVKDKLDRKAGCVSCPQHGSASRVHSPASGKKQPPSQQRGRGGRPA